MHGCGVLSVPATPACIVRGVRGVVSDADGHMSNGARDASGLRDERPRSCAPRLAARKLGLGGRVRDNKS
eukprot:5906624-Prymnesium_polylepis.1